MPNSFPQSLVRSQIPIQRSASSSASSSAAPVSALGRNLANEDEAIKLLNKDLQASGESAVGWNQTPEQHRKSLQSSFSMGPGGTPDFVVFDQAGTPRAGDVFSISPSRQGGTDLEQTTAHGVMTFYDTLITTIHTKLTKYTDNSICLVYTAAYQNFDTPTFLALWAEKYPGIDITDRVFQIDQNKKVQPISSAAAKAYATFAHRLGKRAQLEKYRAGKQALAESGGLDLDDSGFSLFD